MSGFDDATAVRRREDGGGFDVTFDPCWTIGSGRPNGGYLLAVLGRAALAAGGAAGAGQEHIIAATVQYVSSPAVGPARAETEVLRIGRTASQVRGRLVQDGAVTVEALFTLGHLAPQSHPVWGDIPAVSLPPEDRCVLLPPSPTVGDGPSVRQVALERFDPSCLSFVDGEPSGAGELRTWFRFHDERPVDTLALLFVVDALPPATFEVAMTGWVPTLDLTAYIRAIPAPGPLRVQFRAGMIQDGFCDETCTVWDSRGRLVAQSTQLVAIRLPG